MKIKTIDIKIKIKWIQLSFSWWMIYLKLNLVSIADMYSKQLEFQCLTQYNSNVQKIFFWADSQHLEGIYLVSLQNLYVLVSDPFTSEQLKELRTCYFNELRIVIGYGLRKCWFNICLIRCWQDYFIPDSVVIPMDAIPVHRACKGLSTDYHFDGFSIV